MLSDTPGHSAIANATVQPTANARVIAAATIPLINSPGDSGGISRSMIVPCILPDSSEKLELAKAFCIIAITIRPGATKLANGTPSTSRPCSAQRDGENHQKQQCREGWSPDRLRLHLEKSAHLLHIEGKQTHAIDPGNHRNTARGKPGAPARLVSRRIFIHGSGVRNGVCRSRFGHGTDA